MVVKDLIQAIYTERTCGDACWHAREDICRCSCVGRNHGILRNADGEQPVRTRRINGAMYTLHAVPATWEDAGCIANAMRPIEDLDRDIRMAARERGILNLAQSYIRGLNENPVTVIKTASKSEVEKWPELASFRPGAPYWRPGLLWVRSDCVDWAPTA